MTILRDLSVVWSLFHAIIIFVFLYDFRYSFRKTLILTGIFTVPLIVLNILCFLWVGPGRYVHFLAPLCAVPALIFFLFVTKKPDGRFFFTFCLSQTVAMEITGTTSLLDFLLPGDHYVVMFVSRLIAFPLLEFFVIKYLRKGYIELQNQIKIGWWLFTVVSVLFYISLVLESSVPFIVTDRLEYLPHFIVIFLLMPLVYFNIFSALHQQSKRFEAEEASNILRLHADMIEKRAEDIKNNEDKMRIERHDMRHRLNTIASMIKNEDYDEALDYMAQSCETLDSIKPDLYCQNPVLNAVISYYFQKAQSMGIRIEYDIALPNEVSINVTELSTVFANAFQNAINACAELPEEKRVIKCKCLCYPNLIFSISNPYAGTINVDSDGFPVSDKLGHGIGTRSIKAFCKKYNTTVDYKITDEYVDFRMAVFGEKKAQ